jgi:Tfp pilus assembly protein PilF/TolB-like protein
MWRRCLPLPVLATVFVICTAWSAFAQAPRPATPGTTQTKAPHFPVVLTFPFENTGQESSLEWLSEGFAELTIQMLSGHGYYLISRQERLNALENIGLPVSTRFSRATMLKLGEIADADEIIFGRYSSDGSTLTVSARVLHLAPPSLSPEFSQSGALADVMAVHARLEDQLSCALASAGPRQAECNAGRQAASTPPQLSDPISPAAFEAYVKGLIESNDDERIRSLREATRLQPTWDAPAFAIGDGYFTRRNCGLALPWLTRVPATSASGPQASFETGVCYLLRGDPVKAQDAFAALLKNAGQSSSAEAQNNFGVALARDGKFVEALEAFSRAIRSDAEDPDYWFNLGLLHLRSGTPDPAVDALRRTLALQPRDTEARTLLAFALDQSGRGGEADAERVALNGNATRVVIPRNPAPADFSRFDRIRMRPDFAGMRPAFDSPTQESSDAADAPRLGQGIALHLERGRQFLESGALDDAQRAFIEALLVAPLDADAHTGLAQVYERQGRPNDGVREYRAALATRDDLPTHVALAGLLIRQDRNAEAGVELRRVLDRDPDNSQAQELLDQLTARFSPNGSP